MSLLRLEPSRALRERRLLELLGDRPESDPALQSVVRDAQLLGSLELSGHSATWEEVRSSSPPPAAAALRRAQLAASAVPLRASLLAEWHAALGVGAPGYRRTARERAGGPPPAPPEFVPGRLELLDHWLGMDSFRELGPSSAAALCLARIVEILPFEDGNGRVSRLAASHVMVRAGLRPPILVQGDRPRLEATLQAAFRLDMAPLAALLEEASSRAVEVMIQALSHPETR